MSQKLLIKLILILLYLIILYYNKFNGISDSYKNLLSNRSFNTHFIVIVLGTRSETVKMIPILRELKNNKKFFCLTINIAPKLKYINEILDSFNISNYIDIELNILRNNQPIYEMTSKIILELNKLFLLIHPDALIVQGDTTTSFAAALSAFYQNIKVFHIEPDSLYSFFKEKFNRRAIDDIAELFFTSSELDANYLLTKNKNPNNIFVTGNTIVDTLKLVFNNTSHSNYIQWLLKESKKRCKSGAGCKIILLTCQRRANFINTISNFLKAVQKLLENINDIIIIIPFNLNPIFREYIRIALPEEAFNDIINNKVINNKKYFYFSRLLLIKPLNFMDFIHLQSLSFFIMTDSLEIQEECISIGKPVLILREKIESLEDAISGSTIIVGIESENIYNYAKLLLKNETLYNQMSKKNNIYDSRNSSKMIVNLIEKYFNNKLSDSYNNYQNFLNKLNYSQIISKFDYSIHNPVNNFEYDLVIVLTVWKRNNLDRQLTQIKRQTILKNKKTNIIVFQNSNHINVEDIISKWENLEEFNGLVKITFIKSPIDTGYFGRFLSPFTSSVTSNSYFIICDDDVIWGDRYFENMIRVVDEGFLATRTGRFINENFKEFFPAPIYEINLQVCFNEDIEYDFGGQIWAGRISWLRKAWTHIPLSIENSEDFWISATLKSFYNISTKTPKCPCPKGEIINPELCAASDKSAYHHDNGLIGNISVSHTIRTKLIKETSIKFNYKPLMFSDPKISDKTKSKFQFGNITNPLFNLSDHLWDNVLFWQ